MRSDRLPKKKPEHEPSNAVAREQCPECAASGGDNKGDNLVRYDDGHAHCFACGYNEQPAGGSHPPKDAGEQPPADSGPVAGASLLKGGFKSLPHRGISSDTCKRFDYRIAKLKATDELVEVANYYRDGKVVGQKIRTADKKFKARGDMKSPMLFGQQLWKNGGKRIIITEGEIDAMSIYEAMGNKPWPVVSLPSGAGGAEKAIRQNLEFLSSYEEVVLCFDEDEPGREASAKAAVLLPPGKAKIAKLPRKDANEMLVNGEDKLLLDCLWQAQEYRPDGIVHVSEITDCDLKPPRVLDYGWESMTTALWGRRTGELCMHTSGSGMGKSTVIREMIDYDLSQGLRVGAMMLEEGIEDTLNDILSLRMNLPIRKLLAARAINERRKVQKKKPLDFGLKDTLTEKAYAKARAEINKLPLFLYDHFGSLESDTLMQRFEYLATGLRCDVIYLDHVSIVISGTETDNEVKAVDMLMTKLRSLVERTGVRMEAVCHLRKSDGKPFEEGGQISLRDLRGSGALFQLADAVLAYERNQQDADEDSRHLIRVRSMKDRFSGFTGLCAALKYDKQSGRLAERPFTLDEKGRVIVDGSPADPVTDLFDDESTEELT